MPYCVGIDLIDIDEVRNAVQTFGDGYLERVYTANERRQCGASPACLAGRFAAKEAAMKALTADDRLPWHSIEVVSDDAGRMSLGLTGEARELAERRGVGALSVSLTRAATHAGAVVLGRSS